MKKLKFYFYGDTGVYDDFNPSVILNDEIASEIIYTLAINNKYDVCKIDLINKIKIDQNIVIETINNLVKLNIIDVLDERYKLNISVFLEADIILLKNYLKNIGKLLGEIIIDNKNKIYDNLKHLSCSKSFSYRRILYHIICDQIFDNRAFTYLSNKGLLSMSKKQPGNRDYIIFAYEDCLLENEYNSQILCSSNNYTSGKYTFNSFGDSNGDRCDFFRFFRKINSSINNLGQGNLAFTYLEILSSFHQNLVLRCGELIEIIANNKKSMNDFTMDEQVLLNFLCDLGYIFQDHSILKLQVPIFYHVDELVIDAISDMILNEIYEPIKKIFMEFRQDLRKLTPVKHDINITEIANELWHHIFGATNEYLINSNFIENPIYKPNEGRYFKSIIIN